MQVLFFDCSFVLMTNWFLFFFFFCMFLIWLVFASGALGTSCCSSEHNDSYGDTEHTGMSCVFY